MKSTSFILGGLLLISYLLPWVVTPDIAAMTNSAYDFAEWLSIHPLVRADLLLLPPLLLRLPLACIALYLSFDTLTPRWIRVLVLLLLVLAQMPPLEYFREASGDPNYQQMGMLATATLILGILILSIGWQPNAKHQRIGQLFKAGLIIVSLSAAILGTSHGLALMQGFATNIRAGVGIFLHAGISVLCLLMTLHHKKTG